MDYRFEIWRDAPTASDAPLITADLVYVNVDVATGKPTSLPDDLRARVRGYERVSPTEA
jgi:acyl-CoA thioesterase FadM